MTALDLLCDAEEASMVMGDLVTGLNMHPLIEVEDEGGLLTLELEPQLQQGVDFINPFTLYAKVLKTNLF